MAATGSGCVATLCVAASMPWLHGCESCQFSFGDKITHAVVQPSTMPVALRVRLCESAEGAACDEEQSDAHRRLRLKREGRDTIRWLVEVAVPAMDDGWFACKWADKHFLLIDAANCRRVVLDLGGAMDHVHEEMLGVVLSCTPAVVVPDESVPETVR
jgi:hypothetical protein